jgi:hypothetical protein
MRSHGSFVMVLVAASFAAAVMFGCAKQALAPPCQAHKGDAKRACIATVKRDRMEWPPNPTARDLRVRSVNVRKFIALGKCEAGHGSGYAGVRWHTPRGWKWQGAYGLYYSTHQSVGHPYGTDAGSMTWQQQTLVAERVRLRYGIGAWGAASCWING